MCVEFFFYSISDDYLEGTDVDLESVISYIDIEPNSKVKTEVVENGFSTELEEDGCDVKGMKETHMMDNVEFCPVGPHKAALLYPLCVQMKDSQCGIYDLNVCVALLKMIFCYC